MRLSKTLSRVPGYCLWLLIFAMALILLGALSPLQSQMLNIRTKTSSDHGTYVPRQVPLKGSAYPPVLAYWIFGTKGDGHKILRLLKAVYHPRNQYLLQLDAASSYSERLELALSVQSERLFQATGNVDVVGQSNTLNHMGSSALAAVLHAAALLLKISADWDWFVTLSASDYPLMSQDDILHGFTFLPRDLNLISYTNKTSLKEGQNMNQIVDDPSLYLEHNSPIHYAVETRATPDVFQIFGGSPWVILTRSFTDYCVSGWDNLPRKLLMYFSNTPCPAESYFHTVLCNSPDFQNTILDTDLRYTISDVAINMYNMVTSGAAFARPFQDGDTLLNKIDGNVLNRTRDGIVPGKWCLGGKGTNKSTHENENENENDAQLCSSWDNMNTVKPGSKGFKLEAKFSKLLAERRLGNGSLCQSVSPQ